MNDAGNLSASDLADYWGLVGMQAVINDNNAIYVQDDTPNSEAQYRNRFYVNPNSVTMASGDILDLFTGRNSTIDVLRIQLQKTATSYQVRSSLLNDAGTWTDTTWFDIPNAWSAVEIQYQAFANSGSLTLWLDDAQKQSLTFIDNDTRTLTDVRLGAQGIETGTRGTIYFDDPSTGSGQASSREGSRTSAHFLIRVYSTRKRRTKRAGSRALITTARPSLMQSRT